jgi:hemoglobin/transferrin/lactoferrin receptor protein
MKRIWIIVVMLGLVASPPAAIGQDADTSESATDEAATADETESPSKRPEPDVAKSFFGETTVTATGSEEDTLEVSTPVTILGIEEIEAKMPDNAADLLREEPGVDVNGVGPNQARPVIRGQRGLRVLFLENGLRMNNPRRQTDFGEIPGLVDMDSVAQMEVVRGPASVLYGSDAIGGVLNLITRVPAYRDGSKIGGDVGLRYGTAGDAVRANASIEGRSERTSFRLGLSTRNVDDYTAASGTFGEISLDEGPTVIDSGIEDDSVSGYLGRQLGEGHEMSLKWNRYRADQAGFGFVEPGVLGEEEVFRIRILYPYQNFDRWTLGYVGAGFAHALADTLEVQAYYQQNERELVNDIDINIGPLAPVPGWPDSTVEADTENFTDLETFGARIEAVKVVAQKHILTYGFEFFEDESVNTDFSQTTTTLRFPGPPFEIVDVTTDSVANAPNASNSSYGAFAQGELEVGSDLKVTVGGRYQNVATNADETPGWDIAGLDFDDDNFVGAVSLLYRVNENLRLIGGYGTAFRAPNIVERLFNGLTPEGIGYQVLNPDLQSETSENFDLGLKYRRETAFMEIAYFENTIEDGIIQNFLSPAEIAQLPQDTRDEIEASGVDFVVQQVNADRLRYDGIEISLGWRSASGLTVGGNYTHLNGKRIDSTNPPTGDTVTEKINAYVRWQPLDSRYWAEYRLRRNGDERANIDPDEGIPAVGEIIPSFTIHTLAGGVTLYDNGRQAHELGVVVDNVSDELYAEFSNATFFRPEPERNVTVTYRLKY